MIRVPKICTLASTGQFISAAALFIAANAVQASTLVTNGSFENPGVSSWGIFSSISGWTGGAYGIEIQPSNTVGGVTAFDGNQYVELDTTANSSMWQNLSTTANTSYTLSFAYMPRPDTPGGSPSNTVEVYWGGSKLGSFSGKSKIGPWLEIEFDNLTPTVGPTTRLEFLAAGTSDSYGGFIDDVVVSAVPENETWALLLAGLGLIGAVARGRNRWRTIQRPIV